jgi:hypothetical protein
LNRVGDRVVGVRIDTLATARAPVHDPFDRQPAGLADLTDQTAGVVLPPVLSDFTGIPKVEQRLKGRRQVSSLRHLGAFDQRWYDHKSVAAQRGDDLVPDQVAFVVEPRQVVGVAPARADHNDANRAPGQSGVDLLTPLRDADALHVAKHPLAFKTDILVSVCARGGARSIDLP